MEAAWPSSTTLEEALNASAFAYLPAALKKQPQTGQWELQSELSCKPAFVGFILMSKKIKIALKQVWGCMLNTKDNLKLSFIFEDTVSKNYSFNLMGSEQYTIAQKR